MIGYRVWILGLHTLLSASAATAEAVSPFDCGGYFAEAKRLNAEVQALIGEALKKNQDVGAPQCRFRSEEWSSRQEKHQAWCQGKDAPAFAQRLEKMTAEVEDCRAVLSKASQSAAVAAETKPTPLSAPNRVDSRPGGAGASFPSPPGHVSPSSALQTGAPPFANLKIDFTRLAVGPFDLNALRGQGVRFIAKTGVPTVYAAEPNMVLPQSQTQVLLVGGSVVTALVVEFTSPVSYFSFMRAGTRNGASTPTWRAEAFGAGNRVLGAVGEEHGLPEHPQTFVLRGSGIVRVEIRTDNRFGTGTWATWNSLPVVELEARR